MGQEGIPETHARVRETRRKTTQTTIEQTTERRTMIYKRGKVYWFSFWFNNKRIQKSTKQGNPRVARQIEAAYRTKLSKGEVGITDPKESPVVKGFAEKVFLPRMRDWHKNKPNTVEYYETGIKRLMDFEPLANARLSEVDEALI